VVTGSSARTYADTSAMAAALPDGTRDMRRALRRQAGMLLVVVSLGCEAAPSAPILSDSPIYHNKSEGLRFLVPDGWTQTASSVLPPGELDGEIFLVRYRVRSAEVGATLQVLCMSDSQSTDLESRHAGASFGIPKWDVQQPRQTLTINSVKADRIIYQTVQDGREVTKHVTCFQHNHRVYAFVGLYYSTDEMARQQIERATESVIWER